MEKISDCGVVIVTGASSGIGKACALKLAQANYCVFAGMHSHEAVEECRKEAKNRIIPLLLDVTDKASITAAFKTVEETIGNKRFIGIVNNAGTMTPGPLEFMPADVMRHHFEVNTIAPLLMVQTFLPLLKKYQGRIVNIGSTSCKIFSAFQGPYCASKAALLAVTEVLKHELQASGVRVSIVVPGAIATPLWSKAATAQDKIVKKMTDNGFKIYGESLTQREILFKKLGHSGLQPVRVADAVCKALTERAPKPVYVIGWSASFKMFLAKVLPSGLFNQLKSLLRGKCQNSLLPPKK